MNPQVKYKVIDIVRRQGTGWEEVHQVLNVMKQLCQPYGKVKISKPERKYSGWDSGFVIKSRVSVNEDNYREGPYISFELYTSGSKKGKPEEIRVSLSGATPRLQELFSSSISSTISIRDMDMIEMEKMILDCLQKVWQSHSKAA